MVSVYRERCSAEISGSADGSRAVLIYSQSNKVNWGNVDTKSSAQNQRCLILLCTERSADTLKNVVTRTRKLPESESKHLNDLTDGQNYIHCSLSNIIDKTVQLRIETEMKLK